MRIKLIIILLFINVLYSYGQNVKNIQKQVERNSSLTSNNKHDIDSIKNNSKELHKIISNQELLIEDLHQKLKTSKTKLVELDEKVKENESKISNTVVSFLNFSKTSATGAIILLIGILLEVIGATLLAGLSLSHKIEPVRNIRLEYTLGDLAIEDKMKNNVMNFYGVIGSIFLVIGFCLQFTGTVLVIGVEWWLMIPFIGLALAITFCLIYFLMGQTVGQSRNEKFKLILSNLKRILFLPIQDLLIGKKKISCELCTKPVKLLEAEIWYKQENNSAGHEYLHRPYGFYLGHIRCLGKKYPEKRMNNGIIGQPHPVQKFKVMEFFTQTIPELENWLKDHRQYWIKRRNGYVEHPNESEISVENIKRKLSKKIKPASKKCDSSQSQV